MLPVQLRQLRVRRMGRGPHGKDATRRARDHGQDTENGTGSLYEGLFGNGA